MLLSQVTVFTTLCHIPRCLFVYHACCRPHPPLGFNKAFKLSDIEIGSECMSPRARKICFCIFLALVLVEIRTRFDFFHTVLQPNTQIMYVFGLILLILTISFREKAVQGEGENDAPEKEKVSQREVLLDDNELDEEALDYHEYYPGVKIDDLSDSKHSFNSSGVDTLVFLHMQKTGGTTLGRRLVDNIGKT